MLKKNISLTTAQFAKLHKINKRTLHYYDEIGLFSPLYKGENHYRYYDYSQSMKLEYILMLKELHMGLDEIKKYLDCPSSNDFIRIADSKADEIEQEIEHLKNVKKMLEKKKELLKKSAAVHDGEIRIETCEETFLLTAPDSLQDDTPDKTLTQLKTLLGAAPHMGIYGSYISVEKIKQKHFEEYDGLFVPLQKKIKNPNLVVCPKGTYLCAYLKGDWDRLPAFYEKILSFAALHHLIPYGFSYETGLNEFAIHTMDDYMTQIFIPVKT